MTTDPKKLAEDAEKSLEILKTNFADLKKEVTETEENTKLATKDIEQRAVLFSERVTQDLLALDGISLSKSKATEAFQGGDRKTAMKLSVLLTRRKTLVRDLNALGERVDKLTNASS